MAIKKFVQVIAKFEEDGRIIPLRVMGGDGRVFLSIGFWICSAWGFPKVGEGVDSLYLPDPE